jgi:DNA modification methylase
MSILLHGDCLEEMKGLDDDSIDLIFCDLPYGQTSCKWDCCIDLEQFWIQVMRIKKLHTPIFMTTTTKFGVSLINSAPKKCHFRYDIVWVKSASAGFLSSSRMPLRKHEMIYVFYEKLPFYDLSSHKHKFLKEETGGATGKEEKTQISTPKEKDLYGSSNGGTIGNVHGTNYKPPLPNSVVKEANTLYGDMPIEDSKECGGHQARYDPPLPNSIIKEEPEYQLVDLKKSDIYGDKLKVGKIRDRKDRKEIYDPPLPNSIVKEETGGGKEEDKEDVRKDKHETAYGENIHHHCNQQKNGESIYNPPLPTSMLEVKSTRGKHSTEKPVALMEWILKYYSKEGDVVLDPTMGSGSTGVACKNMNRNFIGIEMDAEIYEVAVNRVEK